MELTRPDRTSRITVEKPYGNNSFLFTSDEQIITLDDGAVVHNSTGSMTAQYDPENPLDVALYAALEAKVLYMRAKRDNSTPNA